MEKEHILLALTDTYKKIEGIKGLHIPVVVKTIEEYEQAGADEHFIQQQHHQLQKLNEMIAELEAKADRLRSRL